jgi:radical SAM protein with 4Fe4S-binding SPASM domain
LTPVKQQIITPDMWALFLRRLQEFRWRGLVGFHRFGEPLLVPQFHRYISELLSACPKSIPILFTNGDRHQELALAMEAGLKRVIITEHESTKPGWADPLLQLQRRHGGRRIRIRRLKKYGNHAGTMKHIQVEPLEFCDSKSSGFGIDINGNLLMCCEDFQLKTAIWGNIQEKSLEELWFNHAYVSMRRRLRAGLPTLDICKGCFGQNHS